MLVMTFLIIRSVLYRTNQEISEPLKGLFVQLKCLEDDFTPKAIELLFLFFIGRGH